MAKKSPGQLMREARDRLKKTQAEMAAELEVTQPLIAKWEKDNGLPRTEDVRAVAAAYGLKPEQLLPDGAP